MQAGHSAVVPPALYGLNGGLTAGLPIAIVLSVLVKLLGAPGTWLPLLLFFPLAAWSMGRLVGGPRVRRLAAAGLFCVNPFVFQRIYVGHLALLLGYALLPLGVLSLRRYLARGRWWAPGPALWWAVLTGLSPHLAWIFGVVVLAYVLTAQLGWTQRLVKATAVLAAFVVLNSYILFAQASTSLTSQVGTAADLSLYRTTADHTFGLFGNVVALYGFWRLGPGPVLPKQTDTGWPLLLLAILVVVAVGAWRAAGGREGHPEDKAGRRLAIVLGLSGLAGLFLAMGGKGPTGFLFRWAYVHLPFFNIMREPQKFLMLTVLAYAYFFGWGVEQLTRSGTPIGSVAQRRMAVVGPVAALVLSFGYTPNIFDGLAGQISVIPTPASWTDANRLMGTGAGQVLFLPWHLYLSFPFTGRVTANPAPAVFSRPVISGDNVEAGAEATNSTSPRSTYLTGLFSRGPQLDRFGAAISPLGVQYVVLAQTVDWQSYSWVVHQTDLRLVFNRGGLEVWRNLAYRGPASAGRQVEELSPHSFLVGPGRAGVVSLDLPYVSGWRLGREAVRPSPQGVLEFDMTRAGGRLSYQPWSTIQIGYALTGFAVLALALATAAANRSRREEIRPSDRDDGSERAD